jgi:hypothetical protein
MKQKQHRPTNRAPHGSPIYSKRIAAWVTPAQRRLFDKHGGSEWVREVIAYWAKAHR